MADNKTRGGGRIGRGGNDAFHVAYVEASNKYNRGLQRELHQRIASGGEVAVRTNIAHPFIINRYSNPQFEKGGVWISRTGRSKPIFLDNDDLARALGKPTFFQTRIAK